jgi:diguanylate cyclase (GGDEF)-like protein
MDERDDEMRERKPAIGRAERDLIALGIAAAAILMFVGTGGTVLPQIARSWTGTGDGPDILLVNALLLNIALIIFGWRRYTELNREIVAHRKAEETARILAETDPLTNCLNRRRIGPETDQLLMNCRKSKRVVAFFMIDLDNFKQINDLNGHKAGDEILVQTAERMRTILPKGALLARLGGDEFACAFPIDAASPDRADQFAARLIERIARPVSVGGSTIEVTASIGIASSLMEGMEDAERGECLMHKADIAMYHAKKQGRNRYFWFEPEMENELRFRHELERGIRRGISHGEFLPYYEQQIDLETGELVGFEMLARWESPRFGLVGPDTFIPIAEEIGVIAELSEQLIAQAFEDAKEWDPSLTLSVNISPLQLRDPWFSQKLVKLLVKHNFPPHRLDIEITESCLLENIGMVRSMITSLRNQGVRISLDDFGTGYSSLSQLRTLPFDRLKIDRSFISELSNKNANSKIIRAIVSLGDGLNLPITAEGIEDEQILTVLKSLGQLKGQGYHYGHPEDSAMTRKRLAKLGKLVSEQSPAADETGMDTAPPRLKDAG